MLVLVISQQFSPLKQLWTDNFESQVIYPCSRMCVYGVWDLLHQLAWTRMSILPVLASKQFDLDGSLLILILLLHTAWK